MQVVQRLGASSLLIPFPCAFEPDVTRLGKFFAFVVTYKFTTLKSVDESKYLRIGELFCHPFWLELAKSPPLRQF